MNKELSKRKGNTKLRLILGQAGSGKSTKLFEIIKNEDIRPIFLCSKWLLVRQTQQRLKEQKLDLTKVTTIQSIVNNPMQSYNSLAGVDTIILDEFSQIDYNSLLVLIDAAEKNGINNIIAAGDFLQNEPIFGGSYSPMRLIIREFLLGKSPNFFASLIKTNVYQMMHDYSINNSNVLSVPSDLKTMFNHIEYDVLIDNHRQNNLSIRTYEDMLKLVQDSVYYLQDENEKFDKIKKAVINNDWQIIVADWKEMSLVNEFVIENELTHIVPNFYIDIRGYQDRNYRNYYRQDDGKYYLINGRDQRAVMSFIEKQYIQPTYAIIADSAQGLEFENVLIVSLLDNFQLNKEKFRSWSNFSFNTLYMAMTRHKNEVDICVDKEGWKDIRRTLDIVPPAQKKFLQEEWFMYCVMQAPDPKVGFDEYNKFTWFKFIEDDKGNVTDILSRVGFNKSLNIEGTIIVFDKIAKKEILLRSEFSFMSAWKKYRGDHEIVDNVIKKTRDHVSTKKSVVEIWVDELSEDEKIEVKKDIDDKISRAKFKEKWNKDIRAVKRYI